jgi:UDP-N-acetylmuramate--alanine ligase
VRFTVLRNERPYAKLALRVPGEHNVLNALAAAAVAHEAGVGAEEVRASLAEFPGVKRRFEPVGRWNGAVVIDDYAHHPTAVRCTLKTARQRFPGRPLWCLFQPHQVSRTLALLNEFAAALVPADRVLVAPVYSAREPGGQADQAGRLLCDYINAQGGQARFMASLDRARATLDDELAPGDVLVTMGAGDINQVHHAFAGRA